MVSHIQHQRSQKRHAPPTTYRDDLKCYCSDVGYEAAIKHGFPTRDAAMTTKTGAPIDVKSALENAGRILSQHAASMPARDDAGDLGGFLETPKAKQERLLGPAYQILEICRGFDTRLRTLEAKRAAQRAQPPMQPQPTAQAPAPMQTKDATAMIRNPQLAPVRHVTFNPKPTRDQLRFGETPSRFNSREQDRLSRQLPEGSAGPMSVKEMNDANHSYWARDNSAGMLQLGSLARAGKAPSNTPYSLDGGDGRESHGENCVNISGPPGNMATSVYAAEAFASELEKVPTGQSPNGAINLLNGAVAKARDSATVDALQRVWSAYVKSYGKPRK